MCTLLSYETIYEWMETSEKEEKENVKDFVEFNCSIIISPNVLQCSSTDAQPLECSIFNETLYANTNNACSVYKVCLLIYEKLRGTFIPIY